MTKNEDEISSPIIISADAKSIKYYKQIVPVTIHHFYIIDEIQEVDPFLDLINTLKTAEQHDTIFISLNTPGGSLHTAIQIISAIKQSSATVITSLEGSVCSAGTMIFLAGHKFMVNPNCTFMIHNYSQWAGGKGNEIALQVKYQEGYFKKLAQDIYGSFLTQSEIEAMLQGKDLWMDSDEVLRRLKPESKIDINGVDEMQIPTVTPVKKSSKKKIKKKN